MKKFLALILSLAMVFALVACGGEKTDDNQNNDGDTSSPVSITLATGGTSGTYYAVGGVLKTVLGDKLTLSTLNVESTGASVANVNMITDGEAQMAILQSDVINYAHEGTNSFDGAPETNALWVAGIYNETVQILAKPGINTVSDLKGKTVVAAGKGSTPEYALRYLLSENGIDPDADVTLDWKSEHSECVAALASGQATIALLPQPFVTVAQSKIEGLRMALDLTEEWDKLDNGSALITGVIVARSEFVEAHPAAVGSFLTAYAASVDWVNANTADAAALIGEYGIVDAAVAEKALPYCNIVCITGAELLEKLPGYLSVLYNADPAAVGGAMPDNSFYFA